MADLARTFVETAMAALYLGGAIILAGVAFVVVAGACVFTAGAVVAVGQSIVRRFRRR